MPAQIPYFVTLMYLSRDIGDLLFQRTLNMPDHTQLKRHDNTVASMDVYLHTTNKQNISTLPRDIGDLLFWRALDMPKPNKYYII